MDKKTLIAVGVAVGLGLMWTLVFGRSQSPPPAPPALVGPEGGQKSPIQPTPPPAPPPVAVPTPTPPSSGAAPAAVGAAPVMPKTAHLFELKHELFTAKVNSQGATLESFALRGYDTPDRKGPMDLVGGKIVDPPARPLAVELIGDSSAQDALYGVHDCVVKARPGSELTESITCTWTDGKRYEVSKKVSFRPASYLIDVEVELRNLTDVNLTTSLGLQMTAYQEPTASGGGCFSPPPDLATPICGVDKSIERNDAETLSKKHAGRQIFDGAVRWAGVDHRYFLVAAMVRDGSDAQDAKMVFDVNRCELVARTGNAVGARIIPKREFNVGKKAPGERVGKPALARFTIYLGPKEHKVLEAITVDKGGNAAIVGLDESVDFWILGFLCKPMLWLLNLFFGLVGNYGIAIILLTLVVKIITFWPSQKSYRSMEGMKKLKGPMEEIRAKYASDRSRMNQEMMGLYKTHKINPLGGCLPMVLQMPIWIALYRTIYSSVEIYQKPFFGWIMDLSAQDPYYVLPLLLGAVMFVQQRMTPSTGDNSTMKMMMYGMPVMFTAMMLFFPSGLVLYIFVNTVLGIGQQWLIKRSMETEAARGLTPRQKEAAAERVSPKKRR